MYLGRISSHRGGERVQVYLPVAQNPKVIMPTMNNC